MLFNGHWTDACSQYSQLLACGEVKLFSYTYTSKGLLADIKVIKTITNFIAIIVRILKLSAGPSLGEHF